MEGDVIEDIWVFVVKYGSSDRALDHSLAGQLQGPD